MTAVLFKAHFKKSRTRPPCLTSSSGGSILAATPSSRTSKTSFLNFSGMRVPIKAIMIRVKEFSFDVMPKQDSDL